MIRSHGIALVALLALSATATPALAQGNSQGHGRALGAAARGSASAGVARGSAQSLKTQDSLSRGNSGLNRAANGMQRASAAKQGRLPAGERQLSNQERILDHRMSQAEHLRAVSEANGNERLLDTADRMDGSAITNYERNTGLTYQPPTTDGTTVEAEARAPVVATRPGSSQQKPRGFWFRSR